MDTIRIETIRARGFHGVYEEERERGQVFEAEVVLALPLEPAGRGDDLDATVDYVEAIRAVKGVIGGPAFRTIEAVAENIAAALLEKFPAVRGVTVTVAKPEAPIADFDGRVSVTLERRRAP